MFSVENDEFSHKNAISINIQRKIKLPAESRIYINIIILFIRMIKSDIPQIVIEISPFLLLSFF